MQKQVFLFELDSVRNTDREIEYAQESLFNEIMINGNIVVLTYNQLIDSRGFFSLFEDQNYRENIMALFDKGYIRISQYGDIRTIAQYMINSFEYENEFIYSGWPLKSTQKRLLALIKRSLIYCDLSELNDYIAAKEENAIQDLFIEVDHGSLKKSTLSFDDQIIVLEKLYWLLNLVFYLSPKHNIYIEPRVKSDYEGYSMYKIFQIVQSMKDPIAPGRFDRAIQIIKSLKAYKEQSNKRSSYHRQILEHCHIKSAMLQEEPEQKIEWIEDHQYAEAIIDLCYNYACEISICDISKHYNISDLKKNIVASFEKDFFFRLKKDWDFESRNERYLQKENNTFIEYSGKQAYVQRTVQILNYLSERETVKAVSGNGCKAEDIECISKVPRYEYNISDQRNKWKKRRLCAIWKNLGYVAICIVIAWMIDLAFQKIGDLLQWSIHNDSFLPVEAIVLLLGTELVTTLLSKNGKLEILPLSDALGELFGLIKNFNLIMREKSHTAVRNTGIKNDEVRNRSNHIQYVLSPALKKYQKLREKEQQTLFCDSSVYAIEDTDDSVALKRLLRDEELFNHQYGIIYRSDYNTMCIDPIINKSQENQQLYKPYERIIPTKGNGVVMVTKKRNEDTFVFLKQYRHAPRKIQYSFPRGFAEDGILSIDNAKKELLEEMGVEKLMEDPVFIGTISPDSGLTSSCVNVYLVELEEYSTNISHEGIIGVQEISFDDLKNWLEENHRKIKPGNRFDDGFTLAALELYKTNCRQN